MKKIFFLIGFIIFIPSYCLKNLSGTSYTRLNNNNTSCNPKISNFVGVFGDAYVNERNTQISLAFQYSLPTDKLTIVDSGSGSVTQSNAALLVSSGTDATCSASVQSIDVLHYSPGKDGSAFFTAGFTDATSAAGTTTQLAGLYDSENGFAIGYQNTSFGLLYRNNSTDQFITQSNFNIDPLDGTGPSRFIIDPTKVNVFRISYGWLGTAPVTYEVLKENGQWIPFHRLQLPNTNTDPSIANPTLPIKIEVEKDSDSNGVDLTVRSFSWNASILGNLSEQRQYTETAEGTVTTTETPIISLRNNSTFNGQNNLTTLQLVYGALDGADSGFFSTTTLVRVNFYINATLTGASFTNVSSTLSAAAIDTSATAASGGTLVYSSNFAAGISNLNVFFKTNEINIKLAPGDILTLTIQRFNGNNGTVLATIIWNELY